MQKTVTKCQAEYMNYLALANNQLQGFGYDAADNMTKDNLGQSYTYDAENRITGAPGYTYTYDGDGTRVEKSNGATGTLYWYMTPGIVAESDLLGNLQSEYVFFDGERVARKDFPSNAVSYYFSDHLKTADVITDAAGNIKSESDYYPWGGELQFLANDSNHYKFTGKERDNETNLDYFGARYYSNGLGRWVSADWSATPIPVPYADFSDPQSLNLYSYVRNVPTTNGDADGHADGEDPPVNDYVYGFFAAISNTYIRATNALFRVENKLLGTHLPMTPTLKIKGAEQKAGAQTGDNAMLAATLLVGAEGEAVEAVAGSRAVGESTASAVKPEPVEGIYEFEDASAPGQKYVGQSENMPRRMPEQEAAGKLAKGSKVTKTEVRGGKTAREIAEHKRIQELGGVRSNRGSKTSNIRNPIGKKREHLLKQDDKK